MKQLFGHELSDITDQGTGRSGAGMPGKSETYILQEQVQLRVGVGVPGDFKQGVEDVVQQLLEVLNNALLLVHIVQTWQLQ